MKKRQQHGEGCGGVKNSVSGGASAEKIVKAHHRSGYLSAWRRGGVKLMAALSSWLENLNLKKANEITRPES